MTDSERAFLTVSELEDLAALASWHIFEAARLMEWGDMLAVDRHREAANKLMDLIAKATDSIAKGGRDENR
jgi:hypothetical protein